MAIDALNAGNRLKADSQNIIIDGSGYYHPFLYQSQLFPFGKPSYEIENWITMNTAKCSGLNIRSNRTMGKQNFILKNGSQVQQLNQSQLNRCFCMFHHETSWKLHGELLHEPRSYPSKLFHSLSWKTHTAAQSVFNLLKECHSILLFRIRNPEKGVRRFLERKFKHFNLAEIADNSSWVWHGVLRCHYVCELDEHLSRNSSVSSAVDVCQNA